MRPHSQIGVANQGFVRRRAGKFRPFVLYAAHDSETRGGDGSNQLARTDFARVESVGSFLWSCASQVHVHLCAKVRA